MSADSTSGASHSVHQPVVRKENAIRYAYPRAAAASSIRSKRRRISPVALS